jgi:hypothetical protein
MNNKAIVLGLMIVASQVGAEGIDARQIYFGGGIGLNDVNFSDDAFGFQVFLGVPLSVKTDAATVAVEIGYMDSGNFSRFGKGSAKANGLWGTAVAEIPLQNTIDLIGRIGLDVGDDDGVMIGAGLGFEISSTMDLRVEYVMRDTIDSFQVNLVIRQ